MPLRDEIWRATPIAAIVLAGFVLRILQIDQSIFGDETWTYLDATQPNLGDVLDFVQSDQEITPPLYPVVVWLVSKTSDSVTILRLPGLISGVLTIPVVYSIGIRAGNRRVALLAAALAALSPFLAFYSIELRAYSLAVLLGALSTLAMLLAVERRKIGWWAVYAGFSCLAMYTHYTVAYVLVAQLLWALIFCPEARKPALLSNLLAAVAFLPWLPSLSDDLSSPSQGIIGVLAPFGWHNAVDFVSRFAFGNPAVPIGQFLGTKGEAVLFCGLAVALVGLVVARGRGLKGIPNDRIVLVVALAVAAPVGTSLVSLLGDDQLLPRNVITSAPGLCVALAMFLLAGTVLTRVVATGLVLAAFASGAVLNLRAVNQRPDFNGAAEFIDQAAGPRDVVLDAGYVFYSGGTNGQPLTPVAQTLDIAMQAPHTTIDAVNPAATRSGLERARGERLFIAGSPSFVDAVESAARLTDVRPELERSFTGAPPIEVRVFSIPSTEGR